MYEKEATKTNIKKLFYLGHKCNDNSYVNFTIDDFESHKMYTDVFSAVRFEGNIKCSVENKCM